MLSKGDTIKCSDANEMVEMMEELAKEGVETEFVYEKGEKKGFWLEVTKINGKKKKN